MKNVNRIFVTVVDFRAVVVKSARVIASFENGTEKELEFDSLADCYALNDTKLCTPFELSVSAPGFITQKKILGKGQAKVEEIFVLDIEKISFSGRGSYDCSFRYRERPDTSAIKPNGYKEAINQEQMSGFAVTDSPRFTPSKSAALGPYRAEIPTKERPDTFIQPLAADSGRHCRALALGDAVAATQLFQPVNVSFSSPKTFFVTGVYTGPFRLESLYS